jgi:hypothetical protein
MRYEFPDANNNKFGSFYGVLIPMGLGALVLLASAVFEKENEVAAHSVPDPLVENVIDEAVEEMELVVGECNMLTVMVVPDVDETTDFQDELYKFEGERNLVTIPKINDEQAALLEYAYHVAKLDGHKDPSILQGLIWQESKAGGYPGFEVAGDEYGLRVGKRYYGVGQIKVAAAKDVFRRFPDEFPGFWQPPIREAAKNGSTRLVSNGKYLKTDEEIIAHLIMDDEFNIRVASKYLWIMQHKEKSKKVVFKRPINYAITAYNRGLGNTYNTDYDNWHYTVSVHKHKDTFIKEFNLANNIK